MTRKSSINQPTLLSTYGRVDLFYLPPRGLSGRLKEPESKGRSFGSGKKR